VGIAIEGPEIKFCWLQPSSCRI